MVLMECLEADVRQFTALVREIAELRGDGAALVGQMEQRQGRMEVRMAEVLRVVLDAPPAAAAAAPPAARSRSPRGSRSYTQIHARGSPRGVPQPNTLRYQARSGSTPGTSRLTPALRPSQLRTASPGGYSSSDARNPRPRRTSPSRAQLRKFLAGPACRDPAPRSLGAPHFRHKKKPLPPDYRPALPAAGSSGDRRAARLGEELHGELEGLCREVDGAGLALLHVGRTLHATDAAADKLLHTAGVVAQVVEAAAARRLPAP
eukprot:TRINITY_DN4944_c0_g1_i1.p1 TRINITY_DN4944_c0_g1~~TRINITY_DN4944_c0_g1_i1.p1  ORF type:complete len:293 (+),score=91.76 TRINITY_DN4944_c0_g1_i1:95-880(+)